MSSLIQRLTEQKPEAQQEVIGKFSSRLFMYFRMRIKGEDCYDDLVQEVMISFFAAVKKDKITGDEFIAPFIFGIAKRVMYNFFYKKKRNENIQKKGEDNFEVSYDFKGEENLNNEKLNTFIQQYLKKLPEVDRIIIKEFYLKENNVGEVAEIIGKSKHYVSVRKERALKKIKSEIIKNKDLYNI